MNKYLLPILGSFLLYPSVFAGTPDQDPVIASLRARFVAGTAPTPLQLRINRQWLCRTRIAERNNSTTGGYRTGFVRFDDLFRDSLGNSSTMNNDYALLPTDLVTSYQDEQGVTEIQAYRFERSTGNLLLEISLIPQAGIDFSALELDACTQAVVGAKVELYGVCVATDYSGNP